MLTVVFVFSAILCGALGDDDCPKGVCTSSQTCCKGPMSGMYGCCDSPDAVCCEDGFHCCPKETVCNLEAGTCEGEDKLLIPFIFRKKIVDKPVDTPQAVVMSNAGKVDIIYCPGGQYYCQDNNTCCILPNGAYGCCPYPNAVCCQDHIHCCPLNTHCDSTSTWCLSSSGGKFKSLFKRPAAPMK